MPPNGFFISGFIATRLGLSEDYFKNAFRKGYNVDVEYFLTDNKYLFVKPPQIVVDKLIQDYICLKIEKEDIEDFDFTYQLSKNCLLGFYK